MFDTNIDWTQWILSLLTVMAMMGGLALLLRQIKVRQEMGEKLTSFKSFTKKMEPRIKLKETRLLDARNKVCIIEKDGTEYTVFVTPSGATLLDKEAVKAPQPCADNE